MGIGFLGVTLAFGLTVLTGIYAFGHISGGHFNPAVTIGLAMGRRFDWRETLSYIAAQVVGGLIGGAGIFLVASGQPGFEAAGNMAANGFGDNSSGGYNLLAAAVIEVVLTAVFLYVILGSTDGRAPMGFAGISIGLTLTLIHLISIPVTNTSVNPARPTAVAFFNGNGAPEQLWLFWLAPIIGALIAGATYRYITAEPVEISGETPEAARV